MQIIFLLIGIIGLVMFVFGIKTLIKNYRNEIISELKLTENEINFQKIGTYSICIVGGGYANNLGNFETQITHNETKLNTIEKNLKFKFHYKGRLATEFYSFEIENLGIQFQFFFLKKEFDFLLDFLNQNPLRFQILPLKVSLHK